MEQARLAMVHAFDLRYKKALAAVVAAVLLGFVIGMASAMASGWIGDRLGTKRIFLAALQQRPRALQEHRLRLRERVRLRGRVAPPALRLPAERARPAARRVHQHHVRRALVPARRRVADATQHRRNEIGRAHV